MASMTQEQVRPEVSSGFVGVLKRSVRWGRQFGPRFLFGFFLVMFIIAFGVFGPLITHKNDPMRIVGGLYDPPSAEAWLGTDNFGRDVFTQLMHGTRTSLMIGVISGTVATLIGVSDRLGGWLCWRPGRRNPDGAHQYRDYYSIYRHPDLVIHCL